MSQRFEQRSHVVANEVSFTWKIKNFSALYNTAERFNSYIQSSTFGSSGSYWHLKLFPNCSDYNNHYVKVGLIRNTLKGDISGISKIRIGFKSKTNDAEDFYVEIIGDKVFESIHWIEYSPANSEVLYGICAIRSEVFKGKSQLLLDDVLTVFCHIEYLSTMHENLNEANEEVSVPRPLSAELESDTSLVERQPSNSRQMSPQSHDGICQINEKTDPIHQEDTPLSKSVESILEDSHLSDVASKDVHGEDIYLKQGSVTLSKNIENLFENSRFSDVTLKVGDHSFQAHKAVLASRSKVFEAMFESGMKEGLENEVNMVEMKSATAKEMLQYIYAGKIQELSMDRAMDLYVAADRYDLQELKGWCKDFILKHISADDVTKVIIMADLHRDEELTIAAEQIFKLNSKTILLSKAWEDFARKNCLVCLNLMKSALINQN